MVTASKTLAGLVVAVERCFRTRLVMAQARPHKAWATALGASY
jgi:hypothetical protein